MGMAAGVRRGLVVATCVAALPAATLTGCGTASDGPAALRLEAGTGAAPYQPPRIRMVQANLRIGTPVRQFQADVRRVLSVEPDFVTYDEVSQRHDSVLAPAGYALWRKGGRYKGEAAVAWRTHRWRMVHHGVAMLTNHRGRVPGSRYDWGVRYANWVTLRSRTGLTISVVAAHFPPSTRRTGHLTAPAARRLGALTDRLAKHGPVVVGGDLNVAYRSPEYPRAIFKRHGLLATYDALRTRVVTSGSDVTLDYLLVRGFARFALNNQFRLLLHSDHDGVGIDLAPLPIRLGPSNVRFGNGTVLSDPHGAARERHALVRVALKAISSADAGATIHLALRSIGTRVVRALVAAYHRGVHLKVLTGDRAPRVLMRLLGTRVGDPSWISADPAAFATVPATTLLVNRSGATPAFRLTAREPVGRATNAGWHRGLVSTSWTPYRQLLRAFVAAARG
ncbi:MAG TPA: endonuclease/exonuclease/phosphatase family protein [Nocardioides sp.]|nr:endonuclease/exonuclease/phosphatase family protein [Nocardioides sp.]